MRINILLILLLPFNNIQQDTESERYKYGIKPTDKFAIQNKMYPTDTIRRDTVGKYVYEFWIGADGIHYGTKIKLR